MLDRPIAYFRGLIRRRDIDAEVDAELQFHLEHEIAANIARGMSPDEARRVALRDLGGMTPTQEAVREVRTVSLDVLWRDIRHALRALRRAPGFSAVALVILTLSIGATTAIFSVVDAVVLRGLPFDEGDRLVAVGEENLKEPSWNPARRSAPQNFMDWRAQQNVFSGLAAAVPAAISLKPVGQSEPETLQSQMITADFFAMLRVEPLIGRTFTRENEVDGRASVALISYRLWQRRFGGTPDVLSRRLPGQLADFAIVGVLPPTFTFPVGATEPADVFTPFVVPERERVRGNVFGYNLQVIGRLRDGVTVRQAQAQMDQITAGLAAETPRWFTNMGVTVQPLHDHLTGGVRTWMLLLVAGVAFVMLIACVNLANLMLVRATTRSRELGIRSALGASRWDLCRTLLLESVLLSLGGATLGVGAAWAGVEVLRSAMPADIPRVAAITLDERVLSVTAAIAIATGIIFGTAPVLQFSTIATTSSLNQHDRTGTAHPRTQRVRGVLVVAQVSMAVILLVGAGLFLASFARVTNVDIGIDQSNVLTVRVRPLVGPWNLKTAQERNGRLLESVLEQVRTIPGVENAALLGGGMPLRGDLITEDFGIPGQELPPNNDIDLNQISPSYFVVVKVPLLAGRIFTPQDSQGSEPVVILNVAAARRYFGSENPTGKVVLLRQRAHTIVGVVGNIRHDGPEADWRTQAFVPIAQTRPLGATLLLRVRDNPSQIIPAVKSIVWSQFPDVPIPDAFTLEHYFNQLVAQRRLNMLLVGLFGALGIVIAALGIYGVMSYVVTQRTQEIGIRLALGAIPAAILRSVLAQASIYLTTGIAIGVAGAWVLAGFIESFLFGVRPHDPVIYVSVLVGLIMIGLAAAFVPARRAARVNPLVALRAD